MTRTLSNLTLTGCLAAALLVTSPAGAQPSGTDIAAVGGAGQTRPVGHLYLQGLVARVVDGAGSPVEGSPVFFMAPGSGAAVTFDSTGTSAETVMTDPDGYAYSSQMRANDTRGAFAVEAYTTGSVGIARFDLTNINREAVRCPLLPSSTCQSARSNEVQLRHRGGRGNGFSWKFRSALMSMDRDLDFGNLIDGNAEVQLCTYVGSGGIWSLQSGYNVAAGDGWREINGGRGYSFSDRAGRQSGITRVILRDGEAGQGQIMVAGRGQNLALPTAHSDDQYIADDQQVLIQFYGVRDCYGHAFSHDRRHAPTVYRSAQ